MALFSMKKIMQSSCATTLYRIPMNIVNSSTIDDVPGTLSTLRPKTVECIVKMDLDVNIPAQLLAMLPLPMQLDEKLHVVIQVNCKNIYQALITTHSHGPNHENLKFIPL